MRLISSLFAIAFLTIAYSPCTHASQRLSATDAWVKAPGPNETTATAFVVVNNPTMYDDYLVTATTDVAAKVQIRQAVTGADPKVVDAITVPAYDKLTMKPDGVHLYLVDLSRPLKEGEIILLNLTTDGGIELAVEAAVRQK